MSVVAHFEIHHTAFLDQHGATLQALPDFARDIQRLIALYRAMALVRAFDAKAISLQRTGQLGTYASSLGQEAIGVAVASAMDPADVLLPTYREAGAQLLRGVKMTELLRYWSGDERGSDFSEVRQDFPVCITIATQACHAAGVATAFKLRKQARVAVSVCGDGATSKGDFYEALNVAGAWRLPVVFVVANNQWAISVPLAGQTAAQTLAQKSIAAGIDGVQVDGNDVIAVTDAMYGALTRARTGGGATLIEALTYRLSDHTTADDARRYRDAEEVGARWAFEPLARLRSYLIAQNAWGDALEEGLLADCAARVQAAVDEYLKFAPPSPAQMFDHLYAALPAAMAEQSKDASNG